MLSPTIVAIGHNRPSSLNRLLQSVRGSSYDVETQLVISIDGGGDPLCVEVANRLDWPHGPKRLIEHQTNLGLRDHVLFCGDLTATHGPVILLEDDIVVSPPFHRFAVELLRRYAAEDALAGFSLYSQRYNEMAHCVFEPISNGFAVYLSQTPSSWGQVFTPKQWQSFRDWLATSRQGTHFDRIPRGVQIWPDSSWKKLMSAYTLATGRWFTYPYVGFSTNFAEAGVHVRKTHSALQAELAMAIPRADYPSVEEAVKYDLWWELCEDDVEWDVYGTKHTLSAQKVLSSRRLPGYRQTEGYSAELRPIQMNYYLQHEGDDFWMNERVSGSGEVDIEPSARVGTRIAETRSGWAKGRLLDSGHHDR
jgi:hypothetical protein